VITLGHQMMDEEALTLLSRIDRDGDSLKAADMRRMRSFLRIFAITALLATGLNLTAADRYKSDRDEQVLAKTVADLDAAVLKSDTTTLTKLISDEYTFVDATGNTMGKAQEIGSYTSGDLKIEALSRNGSRTRLYVGGGLVTGLMTIKGKYKNEDISGDYRYVEMFESRKSGDWQLYFSQITKVPEKK
jgi:ketosteroid isomerase-like protein